MTSQRWNNFESRSYRKPLWLSCVFFMKTTVDVLTWTDTKGATIKKQKPMDEGNTDLLECMGQFWRGGCVNVDCLHKINRYWLSNLYKHMYMQDNFCIGFAAISHEGGRTPSHTSVHFCLARFSLLTFLLSQNFLFLNSIESTNWKWILLLLKVSPV